MDRFGDNHLRFENLVNYDKSKTMQMQKQYPKMFENLVNYDKSKTRKIYKKWNNKFENLVNYDKSKTAAIQLLQSLGLRTL